LTPSHEKGKQHAFDAYCKKHLKYSARTIYGKLKKRGEREIAFSGLSTGELAKLAVEDAYFTDAYVFSVLGESVSVSDGALGEALNALPADRREIVLMSYFFDMTDKEIAGRLNMARRTVAYRRTSSLQELKKLIESEG
jgi:DNA-directed RNA polymerase specialized sigma24 family protein